MSRNGVSFGGLWSSSTILRLMPSACAWLTTSSSPGIADGAPTDVVREDPQRKGLLFAGTETQVYVSFDDGDHWESLKIDMPVISVRDLLVKDDSTCLCADLIAATHGRGFWILDDLTPLRQAAQARAAENFMENALRSEGVGGEVRSGADDNGFSLPRAL